MLFSKTCIDEDLASDAYHFVFRHMQIIVQCKKTQVKETRKCVLQSSLISQSVRGQGQIFYMFISYAYIINYN
jgi:hypothetical protein